MFLLSQQKVFNRILTIDDRLYVCGTSLQRLQMELDNFGVVLVLVRLSLLYLSSFCLLRGMLIAQYKIYMLIPGFSRQNEALHFYAVFGASFLDFLLFSLVYLRTLIVLRNNQKWRSSLAEYFIRCSAVAIIVLISSIIGWRIFYVRRLLLDVSWTESLK